MSIVNKLKNLRLLRTC